MNGSGCRNCPVEKCETLNYRGSVCAAQRAKLGLGDPNDRTDCWQFQDCFYRNDVGWCPESCRMYRHKDDIRCTELRHFLEVEIKQTRERQENIRGPIYDGVWVGFDEARTLRRRHIQFCERLLKMLNKDAK